MYVARFVFRPLHILGALALLCASTSFAGLFRSDECPEASSPLEAEKVQWAGAVDEWTEEMQPSCPVAKMAQSTYQGIPPIYASAQSGRAAGDGALRSAGQSVGDTQTNLGDAAASLSQATSKATKAASAGYGQCSRAAQTGLQQLAQVGQLMQQAALEPTCAQEVMPLCEKVHEADRKAAQAKPANKEAWMNKAKEHAEKCKQEAVKQCQTKCGMAAQKFVMPPAQKCGGSLAQLAAACGKYGSDAASAEKDAAGIGNHIGDMLKGMQMPQGGGGDKDKKKDKDDKKDAGMPPADGNPTAAYTPPDASTPNDLGLTDWESSETPTAMDTGTGTPDMHNLVGDKQNLLTTPAAEQGTKADAYAKNNTLLKTTPGDEKLDPETGVAKPGEEAGGGAPVDFTSMGGGGASSALGSLFPSNSLNSGLSLTDGAGNLFGVGDLGSLQPVITDGAGNVMREATNSEKTTAIIAKINERDGHAFEKLELLRKSKGLKVSVVDEGKGRTPASGLAK